MKDHDRIDRLEHAFSLLLGELPYRQACAARKILDEPGYEPNAAEVKAIRESSGCGLMDARKALVESCGEKAGALAWLKRQGT